MSHISLVSVVVVVLVASSSPAHRPRPLREARRKVRAVDSGPGLLEVESAVPRHEPDGKDPS